MKTINCGVPQGYSLGPLLFLRDSLIKSECGHFADDTFIMFYSKTLKTIESILNHELKLASNWLKLNKLSLNTDKTQLVIFRKKSKKIEKIDLSIKIDGNRIQHIVDNVKYLGMYLDEHLSCDFHRNQLSSKLGRVMAY